MLKIVQTRALNVTHYHNSIIKVSNYNFYLTVDTDSVTYNAHLHTGNSFSYASC
jgi:hypothetical protein